MIYSPSKKTPTYVNEALNHKSQIDYFLTSSSCVVDDFMVLDPGINFLIMYLWL